MPARFVVAACIAVLVPSLRAAMQGQHPEPASAPMGTAAIAGRVFDADTGAPLPGAIVSLAVTPGRPPANGESQPMNASLALNALPIRVMTDVDGQFSFNHITAGRGHLDVSAHNYVGGGYNQRRPDGQPQTLDIADDQHIGDITLKMWKTGAITGRVIDEAGEPVAGVFVRVLRRAIAGGQSTWELSGAGGRADDRGVYRASGLPAGDYVVEVPVSRTTMAVSPFDVSDRGGARGEQFGNLLVAGGRGGRGELPPIIAAGSRLATYPTTFYPSTPVSSRAAIISIKAGEERVSIDVQLTLVPAFQVSGLIADVDGTPAANLPVELLSLDDQSNVDGLPDDVAMTNTGAQGEFTMLGVPRGEYQVLAVRTMPSPGRVGGPVPAPVQTGQTGWARTAVSVGDRDVTDLAMSLHPALVVSGRVAFDGTSQQPNAQQLGRGVRLEAVGPGVRASGRGGGAGQTVGAIAADGSFAVNGALPGKYMILPNSWPALKWIAKSVTVSGRDVGDAPIDLDADLADVLISFGDKPGALLGVVRRSSGDADTTALVVGFPADSHAWGWPGIHQFATRTTATGTYSTPAVAPGEYLVAAIPDEIASSWQVPDTLKQIAVHATHVTIGDGARLTQNLVTVTIK
jgi:protocatechuate 3,4-dioxygenase beta subunit